MGNQTFDPFRLRKLDLGEEVTDDEWKHLISGDYIDKNRRKAEEKLQDVGTDTIDYMRKHAKTDLYAFSTGVLGFTRLRKQPHLHLCLWMERNADWQFKEILLPRGHFKSTIATIADSLQIILPDDTQSQPWPRNQGTDCRLLICHETDGQASNFLFSITGQILSNPLLMGMFPEIVPNSRKLRLNRHELELPRSMTWPEPTIDTMGVGGRSQGRHYNYIKFDDLIGDKARDSETLMEASKLWFDNVQAFFSDFSQDHFDIIGTRWAHDDLYAHIHRIYDDEILRYIRGVEEPTGPNGEMEPIFPEEFSFKRLRIIRQNAKVFSAQYANNPDEGATEFHKSWKRFYHMVGYNKITVFSGDIETRVNVRDLDTCILFDPAMSGLAGLVVTGTDRKNRVFILEALKDSWKPPEVVDLLFKLVARWQPRLVAIEEVLFSGVFRPWLQREMQFRGTSFHIEPVSPVVGGRNMSKSMRVRGLSNYFSAGMIYFASAGQEDIITEFDNFGATSNYHMLDALAYGPEVWTYSLSRAVMEGHKKKEEELFKYRDVETGYSEIDLVAP